MRLSDISWITAGQLEELGKHNCVTVEQLASLELRDSMADVISIDGLRQLAKRARQSLGHVDPMAQLGQAAGARGAVRYAGGVTYGDGKG